ncbi:hypothetical protein SOASR015_01600 [Pectobacterium carotovorum subsp. carotovorum]|nr:hypothetical protein SOASR015_01600 [Pectobacterium carotovorum subsp. carotovorum]GLX56691.1 hypothetical protein Pcaca02_20000 [Pectobacterium carotovorum subsp. carotovorum]
MYRIFTRQIRVLPVVIDVNNAGFIVYNRLVLSNVSLFNIHHSLLRYKNQPDKRFEHNMNEPATLTLADLTYSLYGLRMWEFKRIGLLYYQ